MDLHLNDEQQQMLTSFNRLFESMAQPAEVLKAERAEPTGHDGTLWERLISTGAVEMAVPEADGGGGASLLDLGLLAEAYGRWVAPVPLIEAQVATRLIARLGAEERDLVNQAMSGEVTLTLALHEVHGDVVELLPAGSVANAAIIWRNGQLQLVELAGAMPVDNLGSLPLADVPINGHRVLAEGDAANALYARARDEWRVLTACALTGLARWSLDTAVGYVTQRHAFGQPIGSFQAIAHSLADRATEVAGAELLARKAAWAQDNSSARFPELALMAFAFATETAQATTYDALHFHGGYGFTEEYAIQLYYRRARAWPAVLEGASATFTTLGTRLVDAKAGSQGASHGL